DTGGQLGRSLTGEVDVNGDGVADIIMGANRQAWVVSGTVPKGRASATTPVRSPGISGTGLGRSGGGTDAGSLCGAWAYGPGADGDIGAVSVGPAGDLDGDGFQDFLIGAPAVNLPGKIGAGKAYLIFGGPVTPTGEIPLSDVGTATSGFAILGAAAGDGI